MDDGDTGVVVVVVPTRHRAELTGNAARPARSKGGCGGLRVLVSDNSTSPEEAGGVA